MTDWRVRGSYFEACNCDAICPCRSVGGQPGGPSTYGICFGTLSWRVLDGHWDDVDLSGRTVVMSLRYQDAVEPSTKWEVVLYVDEGTDDAQLDALSAIYLGRAGGSVTRLYGPAIGTVLAVRRARITVDHESKRKRITVEGLARVEAEGAASAEGDVQCGIPGFDHPGTELFGDVLESTDEVLSWEVRTPRRGSFATDFEYKSD